MINRLPTCNLQNRKFAGKYIVLFLVNYLMILFVFDQDIEREQIRTKPKIQQKAHSRTQACNVQQLSNFFPAKWIFWGVFFGRCFSDLIIFHFYPSFLSNFAFFSKTRKIKNSTQGPTENPISNPKLDTHIQQIPPNFASKSTFHSQMYIFLHFCFYLANCNHFNLLNIFNFRENDAKK